MGFALTVVYIAATIISLEQFGPEWASYHALMYLAVITFLFSLPGIFTKRHLRSSTQTFLMLCFIIAIALSAIANGWMGGAIASWQLFLPSAAIFFFIIANVTTIRRLKILILASVASCLVVVVEALCGYYGGFRGDLFLLQERLYSQNDVVGQFVRLRGAGFLHDPNDLAQILLIALPLIFVAWQRRRWAANILIVLIPAALLLFAIFLTHSRGALLGIGVLALFAIRKRVGTVTSGVLTTVLIFGMLALDFTGGRAISTAEGADRIEAWSHGLAMFKSAPLFGTGFGSFTNLNDITAHNSFVLCLAELGLVGSTIWVALFVTTSLGLNRIVSLEEDRAKQASPEHTESEEQVTSLERGQVLFEPVHTTPSAPPDSTDAEMALEPLDETLVPNHWIAAIQLALLGFITTSWFLSRSYNPPMYLILGLATATIALQRSVTNTWIRARWVICTLALEVVGIVVVYGIVRLQYSS